MIINYKNQNFLLLLSLFSALLCHYLDVEILYKTADVVSEIFVKLLRLISIPTVFLSIVVTLSSMANNAELLVLSKKVIKYTLFTTIVAATIGLSLYLLLDPGKGYKEELVESGGRFQHLEKAQSSFILDMIPSNMIQTFLDSNVIGVVIIALLIGIGSMRIDPQRRKSLNDLFSALFDTIIQISLIILKFLPIAVWSFILQLLHQDNYGGISAEALFWYVACITGANALQALIVLPLLLKLKAISPLETFKGSITALLTAFFSKSSTATMPSTLQCVYNNLKISKRVGSFSIPMCTTVNMNACAAFILITVLFVSEVNGYTFSPLDFIMWIVLATLAAIGNAGVPMGCYFMSIAYLIAMEIPLNIMGLILPLYTVIDMFETSINVWSDICITRIVDKEMDQKDYGGM